MVLTVDPIVELPDVPPGRTRLGISGVSPRRPAAYQSTFICCQPIKCPRMSLTDHPARVAPALSQLPRSELFENRIKPAALYANLVEQFSFGRRLPTNPDSFAAERNAIYPAVLGQIDGAWN